MDKCSSLAVTTRLVLCATLSILILNGCAPQQTGTQPRVNNEQAKDASRPAQLIDSLRNKSLAQSLRSCEKNPQSISNFSIAHRGAPLKYAEHTRESYIAAAKMGAGIMECDATFTRDGELVCRHAQCDLHTTTNIINTPLNNKCTVPWNHEFANPGAVKCCASDLTLAEFKSLRGRMDNHNPEANSASEYLDSSRDWRRDVLVAEGELMTHKESIALFKELGLQFTPELKAPDRRARVQVEDVFGSTQAYAQKLIDDYKAVGIRSTQVWPQSFQPETVLYWITAEPEFARQAVMLDGRSAKQLDPQKPESFEASLLEMKASGVKIIAPPLWMLVTIDDNGAIIPSAYAKIAKAAGLEIITWSLERSDLSSGSRNLAGELNWYYQFDKHPEHQAIQAQGDVYQLLHVLAKDVGVIGVFSDWPETVSYYANCMLQ